MGSGCNRCTSVPEIISGAVTLHVSFKSNHLYEKFEALLRKMNYAYVKENNHMTIDIMCFNSFMMHLNSMHDLSTIEMNDILILPLKAGETVDFGCFINAQNMRYWMTLFQNMDIVNAIENNRIKTVYQPIVENKTLKVYGHEALTRAVNDVGEVIPNDRLFKVSKQLQMLFNLDRQCRIASISNAARQRVWQGKLFVNFIPTVIYDPTVCLRTTHEIAKSTGFALKDIVFEVVESEHVEDYKHLAGILDYYRKKGYETALDDIGTGFSTLSMYEMLRTNYIKIDQSIIKDIQENRSNEAYLQRIIDLKDRFGVKLIAEGVETQAEYAYLSRQNIDYLQGYYFAYPQEKAKSSIEPI